MGQYYRPIIKSKQSKNFKVFNRYVNDEYTMAKLMEHSWWDNYFCGAVGKMLRINHCEVIKKLIFTLRNKG